MLTIPAGYYSLAELSAALARRGVSVRVSPYCADDLYAVRAEKTDWESLRAALVADGQLTIDSDGKTWNMALSEPNKRAEAAALTRLTEAVRSGLQEVYGPSARRAAELWNLPEAERTFRLEEDQRALTRLSGKEKALAAARLGLLAEALTNKNDWNYQALGLPATLTRPGAHFGKVFGTTLLDAGPILAPDGDVRKYPLVAGLPKTTPATEVWSLLQRTILTGKIVWDPLTLATGIRSAVWDLKPALALDQMNFGEGVRMLTPQEFPLDPPSPWTVVEQASLEQRRRATAGTIPVLPGEVDVPNRTMAASEALLRWAQGSGTDLVAYVSPLSDLPLAARPKRSLASVVQDADAGKMDSAALRGSVKEWTGLREDPDLKLHFSLPAAHRLSVSKVGGFTVVRTETRYLDERTKGSIHLPSAWSKARMEDRVPPLQEIVDVVARFHPGNDEGGIAPFGVLAFCNPASFLPFADLLKADPPLLAEVAALGEKETLTRPLPRPEALGTAYAGLFNDAVEDGSMDPIVWGYYAGKGMGPLELNVRRENDRLRFEIVAPMRHEDGTRKLLWSSWTRI